MQEMTSAPQMASPYTPVGGSNMPTTMPQPPKLGTPIPGTTGGLPAKPGLSIFDNPLPQPFQSQTNNPQAQQAAQHAQSYGRGEDSVLIHMTPNEVNSLRGLAQRFGGDLSVNPNTGLPEAGWLGKLLPTLLGAALNFIPGVGPLMAAGIVGAGQTAITGDLSKGLMAGLQAFGGASLSGAVAPGATQTALGNTVTSALPEKLGEVTLSGPSLPALTTGATSAAAKTGLGGVLQNFGTAAKQGLGTGFLAKAAPTAAGMGLLSGLSEASRPTLQTYNPDENKMVYEGPYRYPQRRIDPTVTGEGEISFFDNTNPIGYLNAAGEMRGYAEGGEAKKEERPSWMPDWMQNYKGLFEITGEMTTDQGKLMPTARRALTPEQEASINADREIIRNYLPTTTELYNKVGTGELAAEAYNEQLNKLYSQYNDAANRSQYFEKKNAEQTEATRQKYGTATYSMSQGTGPDRNNQTPTGGLGATAPAATLPAVVPPVTKPEEKISVDTLKTTINPLMGSVTPGSGTGATLGDRVLSPGATQSGAGLEVLKDTYTPKFTQKADYTTQANPAYTLGSQASAALPALTARYATSPGAITASSGYVGGSPSERIRAAAQARAAAKAAGTPTASTATPGSSGLTYGDTPGAASELDFGLGSSAGLYRPGTDTSTGGIDTSVIGSDAFWKELAKAAGSWGGFKASDATNVQRVARGGSVDMRDGAFVVDARTVSELGNGSSNAGIELLQRLGGQPVRGPGDGVSDSVPASIGGRQEARVARDEVIFQPEAVKRLGGGNEKRGTQKLYALMNKAHKARKRAGRGSDTKLRRGLA